MKALNCSLAVTPEQMKILEMESDRAGVSYEMLMENAGNALADFINDVLCQIKKKSPKVSRVIFLCGNGNNAGDCFVAARYLWELYGISSMLFMLCGEPETELAKLNFQRMPGIPVIYDEEEMLRILKEDRCIKADGVFGTGFHGELPSNVKKILEACGNIEIAVDVPSGGNCKTGVVAEGTMPADVTLTFGAIKFGMTQYPLRKLCGEISVADINIPENVYKLVDYPIEIIDGEKIKLPKRNPNSHKGNFGRLLTVCGSKAMPGAALLSACAAARSGIGLLEICAPQEYVPHYAVRLPEAIYLPLAASDNGYQKGSYEKIIKSAQKANTVLIGCGLGIGEQITVLIKKLLTNINCPIILDADGINGITDCINIIKEVKQEIILTPHPAEMARLCGISTAEVQADRLECAKKFAQEYGCTVVLKGAGTIAAYPDRAYVCLSGNPGMSTAGSGDVLSGIISSLKAQGIPAEVGVYIHGIAGDAAAEKNSIHGMIAGDIIASLSEILKEME